MDKIQSMLLLLLRDLVYGESLLYFQFVFFIVLHFTNTDAVLILFSVCFKGNSLFTQTLKPPHQVS